MGTSSMTVVTMSNALAGRAPVLMVYGRGVERQRRLTDEAEMGLEILSHAIEYLAGEDMYDGQPFKLADPRVQAVLLLMECNRDIYLACPEMPTLSERVRTWLGLRVA